MQTRNEFGEGSSLALHSDTIVVNWDHEGKSFIVALDKSSGEPRWRQERDESTSWSTPLVIDEQDLDTGGGERHQSGGAVMILPRARFSGSAGGSAANCIASPVAGSGIVFAMSGHRDPALLAIRYAGARGDLTGTDAVVWRLDAGTPYVPSPLLYGDVLYFFQKNDGILSCHDAKTGKPHYTRQRLEELSGIYPSPVGADGRVVRYPRPKRGCLCHQTGPEVRGPRGEQARRSVHCLAGGGRRQHLPARAPVPLLHRDEVTVLRLHRRQSSLRGRQRAAPAGLELLLQPAHQIGLRRVIGQVHVFPGVPLVVVRIRAPRSDRAEQRSATPHSGNGWCASSSPSCRRARSFAPRALLRTGRGYWLNTAVFQGRSGASSSGAMLAPSRPAGSGKPARSQSVG